MFLFFGIVRLESDHSVDKVNLRTVSRRLTFRVLTGKLNTGIGFKFSNRNSDN